MKLYQIESYFLLDLQRYMVACSTYLSQGNNGFYDVKIKTSETVTKTMPPMKQTNIAVTNTFLNNIKWAVAPVTVKVCSCMKALRNTTSNSSRFWTHYLIAICIVKPMSYLLGCRGFQWIFVYKRIYLLFIIPWIQNLP